MWIGWDLKCCGIPTWVFCVNCYSELELWRIDSGLTFVCVELQRMAGGSKVKEQDGYVPPWRQPAPKKEKFDNLKMKTVREPGKGSTMHAPAAARKKGGLPTLDDAKPSMFEFDEDLTLAFSRNFQVSTVTCSLWKLSSICSLFFFSLSSIFSGFGEELRAHQGWILFLRKYNCWWCCSLWEGRWV